MVTRAPVPSSSRRGGRADLTNVTLPQVIGAAGVVNSATRFVSDHSLGFALSGSRFAPVCAVMERGDFLEAQPPLLEEGTGARFKS
jgi:hypothetical protein